MTEPDSILDVMQDVMRTNRRIADAMEDLLLLANAEAQKAASPVLGEAAHALVPAVPDASGPIDENVQFGHKRGYELVKDDRIPIGSNWETIDILDVGADSVTVGTMLGNSRTFSREEWVVVVEVTP